MTFLNAAALVVGIDNYKSVSRLEGAASDALDAVLWLTRIGVPPERIRLHTNPSVSVPFGVRSGQATWDAIWNSIADLSVESGDYFYVFFAGHGLYIPKQGAIFLTEEWHERGAAHANISIRKFVDFFRTFDFSDQFVFVDACQNLSNPAIMISALDARGPGLGYPDPDDTRALTLCCSASQGQYAYSVDGRGLLIPTLIRHLYDSAEEGYAPRHTWGNVIHDWQTGERALDLRSVFNGVRSEVNEVASSQGTQHPTIELLGRAKSEAFSIIQKLPSGPIERATIRVLPESGLDELVLNLRPPVTELSLPLSNIQPPFPVEVALPCFGQVTANCIPKPGWTADPSSVLRPMTPGNSEMVFVLRRRGAPPDAAEPSEPDTEKDKLAHDADGLGPAQGSFAFSITMLNDSGEAVAGLPSDVFDYLSHALPLPHELGVDVLYRPTGLDIVCGLTGITAAGTYAQEWRRSLADFFSGHDTRIEPFLAPMGVPGDQFKPNLKIHLERGGAESLGGFIADGVKVKLARFGVASKQVSIEIPLRDLERFQFYKLRSGAWRVSIDLPWGSWSESVELDDDATVVWLPDRLLNEPLRNRMISRRLVQVGALLFERDERPGKPQPAERSRDGSLSQIWRLGDRHFLVPLGPWGHRTGPHLLATTRDGTMRVEPWSDMDWPEWDLLITAGRLQDVDLPSALARLAEAKDLGALPSQWELLLIALCYAAYAQSDADTFYALTLLQTPNAYDTPDMRLLERHFGESHSYEAYDRIHDGIGLPLFRWGLPLLAEYTSKTIPEGAAVQSSEWTVLELRMQYA